MSHDLLDLQRLDVEADRLRHRRDHLDERAALESALTEQSERQRQIDTVAAARVEVATRQRRHEDQAQIVAGKAGQDEARLYGGEVTGLKDLEALQHEIASLRERQSGFEDLAIEAMEEADELQGRIDELEAARAEIDAAVATHQAAVTGAEAEIESALVALTSERATLAEQVDPALLAEYERLRPAFGAATVVRFQGSCVGCPSMMPAVEVDRIKHLDAGGSTSCQECGRIVLL